MPSNQIPRGWHRFASSEVLGHTVEIILDAVPGVTHVVTGINVKVFANVVGGSPFVISRLIATPWGYVSILAFAPTEVATAPASFVGEDTFSWSGEQSLGENNGGSFVIDTIAATGEGQFLEVTGYDI